MEHAEKTTIKVLCQKLWDKLENEHLLNSDVNKAIVVYLQLDAAADDARLLATIKLLIDMVRARDLTALITVLMDNPLCKFYYNLDKLSKSRRAGWHTVLPDGLCGYRALCLGKYFDDNPNQKLRKDLDINDVHDIALLENVVDTIIQYLVAGTNSGDVYQNTDQTQMLVSCRAVLSMLSSHRKNWVEYNGNGPSKTVTASSDSTARTTRSSTRGKRPEPPDFMEVFFYVDDILMQIGSSTSNNIKVMYHPDVIYVDKKPISTSLFHPLKLLGNTSLDLSANQATDWFFKPHSFSEHCAIIDSDFSYFLSNGDHFDILLKDKEQKKEHREYLRKAYVDFGTLLFSKIDRIVRGLNEFLSAAMNGMDDTMGEVLMAMRTSLNQVKLGTTSVQPEFKDDVDTHDTDDVSVFDSASEDDDTLQNTSYGDVLFNYPAGTDSLLTLHTHVVNILAKNDISLLSEHVMFGCYVAAFGVNTPFVKCKADNIMILDSDFCKDYNNTILTRSYAIDFISSALNYFAEDAQVAVIPINVHDSHFIVACFVNVDMILKVAESISVDSTSSIDRVPYIIFMDSNSARNPLSQEEVSKLAAIIIRLFYEWKTGQTFANTSGEPFDYDKFPFSEEYMTKEDAAVQALSARLLPLDVIPQQDNNCDCGMYAIAFAKYLLESADELTNLADPLTSVQLPSIFSQLTYSAAQASADRQKLLDTVSSFMKHLGKDVLLQQLLSSIGNPSVALIPEPAQHVAVTRNRVLQQGISRLALGNDLDEQDVVEGLEEPTNLSILFDNVCVSINAVATIGRAHDSMIDIILDSSFLEDLQGNGYGLACFLKQLGTIYVSKATERLYQLYGSDTEELFPGSEDELLQAVTSVASLNYPILSLEQVRDFKQKAPKERNAEVPNLISTIKKKIRTTTYTAMIAMAKDLSSKLLQRVIGDRNERMTVDCWDNVEELFNNDRTLNLAWIQLVQAYKNSDGGNISGQPLKAGQNNDWTSAAEALDSSGDIPSHYVDMIERVNNQLFGREESNESVLPASVQSSESRKRLADNEAELAPNKRRKTSKSNTTEHGFNPASSRRTRSSGTQQLEYPSANDDEEPEEDEQGAAEQLATDPAPNPSVVQIAEEHDDQSQEHDRDTEEVYVEKDARDVIKETCRGMQKKVMATVSQYFQAMEELMLADPMTTASPDSDYIHTADSSSSPNIAQPSSCKISRLQQRDVEELNEEAEKFVKEALRNFEDYVRAKFPGLVLPSSSSKS